MFPDGIFYITRGLNSVSLYVVPSNSLLEGPLAGSLPESLLPPLNDRMDENVHHGGKEHGGRGRLKRRLPGHEDGRHVDRELALHEAAVRP